MPAAILFHPEPVHQHPGQVLARRDAPDEDQTGFGLERSQEAVQGLPERGVSEVVETGTPTRRRDDDSRIQSNEAPAGALEDAGSPPDEREPRRLIRCRRLHRSARARAAPDAVSSCQAISPGTPRQSSRRRFVSESAIERSGPNPNTLPSTTKPPS